VERKPIAAPVAAILSSLASLGCCLPLGFLGALGAAGGSAFVTTLRPWVLALSVALLGLGFWQRHRATQCSAKKSVASTVLLWAAVVIVVGMILFPQEIAAFIADHLGGVWKP
jgi:hypothetical protein